MAGGWKNEFTIHRHDSNRTEYQTAAQAGGTVRKRSAGYIRVCDAAGHIQMAAGNSTAGHRQSGGIGSHPAGQPGRDPGHKHVHQNKDSGLKRPQH